MSERPFPTFAEAFRAWVIVGINSFGGPAGQIAVMHRVIVDEKKWIDEKRFLHALNYCMLLPGPEAQQLATYLGWLLHGVRGGLAAGLLFILPGVISILALSVVYALYRDAPLVAGLFYGVKPAVMAIVIDAVIRIARRALKRRWLYAIAAAAFAGIFLFKLPFPLIVAGAAAIGYLGVRFGLPTAGSAGHGSEKSASGDAGFPDEAYHHAPPSWSRAIGTIVVWGAIWAVPIGALAAVFGGAHVFAQEGLFFSKTAVVTFGGAYAVLAYIAQQAVERYQWLEPGEMLDGLGMAETTPGPLIMVVQFVGFMGAYRHAGDFDPVLAGVVGSLVATWATFAPCFLWIFLGAPYIESLRNNRALSAALTGITAAVVGVILNLALWFAIHTLFGEVAEGSWGPVHWLAPEWTAFDPIAAALAAAAALALLRFRLPVLAVIAASALIGVAIRLATGT